MGSFFSSPSAPDPPPLPPPPPPAPTTDSEDVKRSQAQERKRLKNKQGFESTILAGSLATGSNAGMKTLLGQ